MDLLPVPGFQNHPGEGDEQLTELVEAFVEAIKQAQDDLGDPGAARPQLDELVRGPRAALCRWLKARGRKEDTRRVSRKGLLKAYKVWKDFVVENGWPDDARQEEALLSLV
jgi:hypothetical protein